MRDETLLGRERDEERERVDEKMQVCCCTSLKMCCILKHVAQGSAFSHWIRVCTAVYASQTQVSMLLLLSLCKPVCIRRTRARGRGVVIIATILRPVDE